MSTQEMDRTVTSPGDGGPPDTETAGWKKSGVFLAIIAIGAVYIALTDTDVSWGGLISMVAFYALFYYLGAFIADRKAGPESLEDTMVAGRGLPLWIAIFTMTATWVGGGYIAGTAEFTFSTGLAWVQAPWGYAMSLIIGGIFFAPKMRRGEFMTMMDPIDLRFGKNLAGVSYLPALLAETFWSGAILTALGTTFGTILGLDFVPSIILSAAIAIAYTVVGGMWSVAMTDVAQVGIIMVGLLLALPSALGAVGGLDAAWAAYQDGMGSLGNFFPPLDGWDHPDWGSYYWNWWDYALLLIFGGIPWQVYFQRVLSAKDEKTARWLSIGAGFLAMVAAVPAVILGIVAFNADFPANGGPELDDAALALPYVLRYLTPSIIGAVGLGALAAAVMSSVDSSILSASSMGGWNIYRRLINPDAGVEKVQTVIKRLIVIVGVAATLIALNIKSIYELWYLASDFVYVLLFPVLVAALFIPFANRIGAISGFTVALLLRFGGGDATLGLPVILPYPWVEDGAVLFPFRTLAMVSGLLTITVVSYLTRKRDEPVSMRVLLPGTPEREAAEAR